MLGLSCLWAWWIRWKAFPALSDTNYPSVKLVDCCKKYPEVCLPGNQPMVHQLMLLVCCHGLRSLSYLSWNMEYQDSCSCFHDMSFDRHFWHFLWRWWVLPLRVRKISIKSFSLRPEASDSICFQYIGFYLSTIVCFEKDHLKAWVDSHHYFFKRHDSNHFLNDLLCEKILNFPRSNKRAEDSTIACIFQCPLVTLTFFGEIFKLSKPFLLETQLSHCLTQWCGHYVNVYSEHTSSQINRQKSTRASRQDGTS